MDNVTEDRLRNYYSALQRIEPKSRESLLEKLSESPVVPSQTMSSQGSFIMKVSISAAAGLAVAVLVAIAVLPDMSASVAWAEVIKRLPAVESLQYKALNNQPPHFDPLQKHDSWNYSIGYIAKHRRRTDVWEIADESSIPTQDVSPDRTHVSIHDAEKRELTSYDWDYKQQQFSRQVSYRSVHLAAYEGEDPVQYMESLKNLPPESVRKRGRTEKDGHEVVWFETVPGAWLSIPGLLQYGESVSIFVDVQTRLPVIIETEGRSGTGASRFSRAWDIRLNNPPSSAFDIPSLPLDVDGEESWRFDLPSRLWKEEGAFTFRVVGPDGKPLITQDDFRLQGPYSAGGYGIVFLAKGHEKLSRFMARNLGETVTIEIAGEPPIERKIFGRLSRHNGRSAVDMKAVEPRKNTHQSDL